MRPARGRSPAIRPVWTFLDELNRLRLLAPDLSAAQLLWELYDRTGLLGIFGSMAGGQRRQENLLAFYQYTRSCQSRGHAGLFDFVRDLRRVLEQGSKLSRRAGTAGTGSADHVHPQIQGIGVPRGGAGGAVPKV